MTRADWLVIIFASAMLPILYANLWGSTEPAHFVKVSNSQRVVEQKSLAADQQFAVAGDLGQSTLEVKQGKVRFVDSPCRAKVCIHAGWIHSSGQILACVPNGVLVELGGGTSEFDSINF